MTMSRGVSDHQKDAGSRRVELGSMEGDEPFPWLSADDRGAEYVSYSEFTDLPACSFDFGDQGYAASSNNGGNLLQMTARSDKHGIVFARGDFEYSLYLSLARGQRISGGKSAFGLQVAEPERSASSCEEPRYHYALASIIERGCYGYRWPYNEFCLHVDKATESAGYTGACRFTSRVCETSHPRSEETGTCSILSFVMKGVVHQLLLLDPPRKPSNSPELVLTLESPMRLQSFDRLNHHNSGNKGDEGKEVELFSCDEYGDKLNRRHGEPEEDDVVARFMAVIPCKACEQHRQGHDNVEGSERGSKPQRAFKQPCAACSRVHWQAKLAELVSDKTHKDSEQPWAWQDLKLQKMKVDKMDHISKDKDNVTSLPRYRAYLPSTGADSGGARVFLASFCLFEESDEGLTDRSANLPPRTRVKAPSAFEKTPSCREISAFVGIGPSSEPGAGTAAMWEAIFNARQDNMECISQLPEVRIVGRCLEKILGVDVVPLPSPYSALVSNMFLKAKVDLKSLFWKMRFLVKVDRLLSRIIEEADTQPRHSGEKAGNQTPPAPSAGPKREPSSQSLTAANISTAKRTVNRIREVIGSVTSYLVKACLMSTQSALALLPKLPDIGDANYHYDAVNCLYLMITVWYVVKHYPEVQWDWKWQDVSENKSILSTHLATQTGRGDHLLWGPDASMRVKHSMLKWLHNESVLSLQDESKAGILKTVSAAEVERSRYTARTELAKRISSTDPYRADDEIVDRLVFLAEELCTEGRFQKHAARLVNRITKRIQDRKFTQIIKPSHPTLAKEGATDGPWEIHALCHHSRLVVARRNMPCILNNAARADSEEEVEHFRKKLYPFLTTEASLTPCWERNTLSARRGFLRSEATAILASTIVDIFSNDLDYFRLNPPDEPAAALTGPSSRGPDAPDTAEDKGARPSPTGHGQEFDARGESQRESRFRHPSLKSRVRYNGELVSTEALLAQQIETQEQLASARGLGRRIDYLRFRPPRKYHPDEFFHSLDDTPYLYTADRIDAKGKKVPQAIQEALCDTVPRPQRCPLRDPRIQNGVRQQQEPNLASSISSLQNSVTRKMHDVKHSSSEQDTDIDARTRQLLQDILQVGSDNPAVALHDLAVIDIETPDSTTALAPQIKFGANTVKKISDSLIDQEVRHRLLFVRASYKIPAPGLLKLLLYVLHPEMIEGFKNHVMKVSRFGRPNATDGVVAHITLRSWSRSTAALPPHHHMEEDKIEFPEQLKGTLDRVRKKEEPRLMGEEKIKRTNEHVKIERDAVAIQDESCLGGANATAVNRGSGKGNDGEKDLPIFELKVSSVGISTNEFGDFSKCSVITDLVDETDLIELGDTIQDIWDSFIHQPQTGRFLVFAVILGCLCERMAREYRQLIKEFFEEMNLDRMFSSTYLEDRSETLRKRNGDAELRLSLWSLEALYKMSNTMATSVRTIELAIADVNREIQEGPDKRSEELDDMCRTHLEQLERNFSDLSALQIRMERQVELNMRYSSALSAILALRVSQDSYRQNKTIQKLTYLTIGCLPIGLSAALFAVPEEQQVLANALGVKWFVASVFFFLVVLFVIASFLGGILKLFQHLWDTLAAGVKWLVGLFKWNRRASMSSPA